MTVSYFCTFFVVQKCCDNSAQSRQVGFVCVVYIRVLFFPSLRTAHCAKFFVLSKNSQKKCDLFAGTVSI